MATTPRILAFAGSLRRDSYNKRLIRIAADAAREAGGDVTLVDLRDCPLPIFDQDLEAAEGMPENGRRLQQLFFEHQGLMIASPEYNSSLTAALKNAIDWVSRATADRPEVAAFRGKTAAILSASPGGLGGMRALVHLRSVLGNIGVLVLPEQVSISRAFEAFAEDGSLKDAKQLAAVRRLAATLTETMRKLYT